MTDLHAMIAERCAAKIRDGKRPSKADLEWLEATAERAVPPSSVLGLVDGITVCSWMRDGNTYVGTNDKFLADALEDAQAGLYPPQRDMEWEASQS